MNLHVDTWCVQSNILITRDGQACLGDFGIIGELKSVQEYRYKPGMVRYTAPERITWTCDIIFRPSKESDVYSLAMTSFTVRSSLVNNPTT